MRELSNPPELHFPPGFSHVAVVPSAGLCFVAGQLGLDADGNIVGGDSLYEQTLQALRSCTTALASVGLGWEHVVRRTIYTTQPELYRSEILRAIEDEVPGDQPPQTLLGVSGLARPGTLVEIEVTAVLPN